MKFANWLIVAGWVFFGISHLGSIAVAKAGFLVALACFLAATGISITEIVKLYAKKK